MADTLSIAQGVRLPTPEEREFYRINGYLVAKGLFGEAECDAIVARMRTLADERFSAILNQHRIDPEFLKVIRAPRLVSLLEALQDCELVGLHTQFLFKEAGSPYAAQAWNPHQDNSYPLNAADRYITVNILLAGADVESGTIYIYPGSHVEGVLPFEPTISYREQPGTNPGNRVLNIPERYRPVDLFFGKGDVLVMHGSVIHGSHPNVSPTRSRPTFAGTYLPRGEAFVPGDNARRSPIDLHVPA